MLKIAFLRQLKIKNALKWHVKVLNTIQQLLSIAKAKKFWYLILDKVDNIVYNICYMRLSRQGDYAVRAILDLASKPHSQIKEIAERQNIPEAYLQKVIWLMSKEGLIKTLRGPKGGIMLARPPQEIT